MEAEAPDTSLQGIQNAEPPPSPQEIQNAEAFDSRLRQNLMSWLKQWDEVDVVPKLVELFESKGLQNLWPIMNGKA